MRRTGTCCERGGQPLLSQSRLWGVPLNFAGLLEAPVAWRILGLDFQYLLIDISRHGPAPVMGEPRLQGRLLALRAAFTRDLVEALIEIMDRLERLLDIQLQRREMDIILPPLEGETTTFAENTRLYRRPPAWPPKPSSVFSEPRPGFR